MPSNLHLKEQGKYYWEIPKQQRTNQLLKIVPMSDRKLWPGDSAGPAAVHSTSDEMSFNDNNSTASKDQYTFTVMYSTVSPRWVLLLLSVKGRHKSKSKNYSTV